MNRIFVIGDTHFGHKNIIKFENVHRPFATIEEHDRALVERWNATVNPNDTVWHLGDVLFGEESFRVLNALHGVKKLVLGNHDQYPTWRYLEHFNSVHGSAVVRNCLLTHIPVHEGQLHRWHANIHGHLHSKTLASPLYFCASAEQNDLRPMLLDTVIHRINKRLLEYS